MIFITKFGSSGVLDVVEYMVDGYMVLDHFLFLLTGVLCGVNGVVYI